MDEQTNCVLVDVLDAETNFSYLNYYDQKMFIETDDEVYALNLDTLYEWWWQIEGFLSQVQIIMMVMNEVKTNQFKYNCSTVVIFFIFIIKKKVML